MSVRYGPGPWPEEAYRLPDDPPPPGDDELFMPSVVRDGVETHHFSTPPEAGMATRVAATLERMVAADLRHDDLVRLHELLADAPALSIADDLLSEIGRRGLPGERVYMIGRHLAEHGTRREAVKIGLVLIGAYGDADDRDLLFALGTLEEFTLFAVVALVRTQPDCDSAVYELARRVEGWGRIHAVERLTGCDDPEIKAWLLREGFRNKVMDEYLAYIAATTGDLYSALLGEDIDDPLLDGAGDILAALAQGGPAQDICDYAEAAPALHRYGELIADREATLRRLHDLLAICAMLSHPGSLDGLNWSEQTAEALRRRFVAIVRQPRWRDLVLDHLADPRHPRFNLALSAAVDLRLRVIPQVLTRLEIHPLDEVTWHLGIHRATAEEARLLVDAAERHLPLRDLANGPGDHLGLGPGYAPDRALESLVHGLGAVPGIGLPLLRTALANRVTRTRHAALRALAEWPASAVPDQAVEWVRQAAAVEPRQWLQQEMTAFVARHPTGPGLRGAGETNGTGG